MPFVTSVLNSMLLVFTGQTFCGGLVFGDGARINGDTAAAMAIGPTVVTQTQQIDSALT